MYSRPAQITSLSCGIIFGEGLYTGGLREGGVLFPDRNLHLVRHKPLGFHFGHDTGTLFQQEQIKSFLVYKANPITGIGLYIFGRIFASVKFGGLFSARGGGGGGGEGGEAGFIVSLTDDISD